LKVLEKNLITAISGSASANPAAYVVTNVLDDKPNFPYIGFAFSLTITVTISAGVNCFFIAGGLYDSASISVAASPASSGTINLNTSQYSSSNLLLENSRLLMPPEWVDLTVSGTSITRVDTGSNLAAGTITVTLATSVDRRSGVSGNDIASWSRTSANTGRFLDSSGDPVNLKDHQNIMVGSIVTRSTTGYAVDKIIGDGTQTTDILLSGDPATGAITAIQNPIKVGIIRAGTALSVENPTIGLNQGFRDFSDRVPLANGGYMETPKNMIKTYSVNSIMTDANAKSFEGFYRSFRSKPFPALVLDGMAAGQNEDTKATGFFYFRNPPRFDYLNHSGSVSSIDFNLNEVI
tara:strand:+ start:881 stop:1930 length:1050 start_codon:yes stop_codon:yes gene_type:complete